MILGPALIAVEGLDAAGKNTQAKLLCERLQKMGAEVFFYSFPRYETPLGVHIKRLLTGQLKLRKDDVPGELLALGQEQDDSWGLVYQCMMNSDKYDADVDIRRHLEAGSVVVCDRWSASALAYGTADGLSFEWLERTRSALTRADLTIFLRVSEQEARRRRPKLRDRYEKDREKQLVVADNYHSMLSADASWVLVDGESHTGDLSNDVVVVHERVWAVVRERIGTSP